LLAEAAVAFGLDFLGLEEPRIGIEVTFELGGYIGNLHGSAENVQSLE